jgi:hypothetical protein
MLRTLPCAVLLLLATCCTPAAPPASGAPPASSAPQVAAADVPAPPPATAAPAPSTTENAGVVERDASSGSKLLRITTAMPMSGKIDAKDLVAELNAELAPLEPCVALIRKTDHTVGSLNLQVTVAESGAVQVDLQSPVSADAKRCLLQGTRAWRVTRAGAGTAMVLLELTDQAAQR